MIILIIIIVIIIKIIIIIIIRKLIIILIIIIVAILCYYIYKKRNINYIKSWHFTILIVKKYNCNFFKLFTVYIIARLFNKTLICLYLFTLAINYMSINQNTGVTFLFNSGTVQIEEVQTLQQT